MIKTLTSGVDGVDMDIPSAMEGVLFRNTFTKIVWVLLQPFFYAFRPLFLLPKPVTGLEILNWIVQVPACDQKGCCLGVAS